MKAPQMELLLAMHDKLASARHGEKDAVLAEACQKLGCTVQTVYRRFAAAGLHSGRKRRADAGRTAMPQRDLELVSGVLRASQRDNAKRLLTADVAVDMLKASGAIAQPLSAGRVLTLLRQRQLHPEQLERPTPSTQLRSLHPNHVWGIDASTCVLYYVKGGGLAAMDADAFYKNKPANLAQVLNDLCTRFVVADHYSGALKVRYFAGGESAAHMVDFLLWAVDRQDGVPYHGVPWILVLDRGPGNTSHLFKQMAEALRIELIYTGVGNPRAKGFVEKPQDIVERQLEGRFRFLPAQELSLDAINTMALQWAAAYCSSARHTRHGQTRYGMWMRIAPEQLRVPADMERLRDLASHAPVARRVANDMTISVAVKGHGTLVYDVARVPGAHVGGKLQVAVNLYRAPAIDVRFIDDTTGAEAWQTVEPLEHDQAGFRADAPVYGEEFRGAAHTDQDRQRTKLLQQAYRTPGQGLPSIEEAERARKAHAQAYAGVVDAMADVKATPVPAYLPRRGVELQADEPRNVVAPVLTVVEACKTLKTLLGEAYTPSIFSWVSSRFPDGRVPEDQLAGICAQFARPAAADADGERPALRAVGGAS